MKGKLLVFLAKIGLIGRENIYYIGGADVLPPPLKGTQEQEALMALEQGDEAAKQLLIERNLRLVVFIEVGGQAVLGRQTGKTTPWLTERHGYDPTSDGP